MIRRSLPVRAFVASLFWLASAGLAAGHPDIAVTARVLFDVEAGRLVAVAESLAIDEASSRRMIGRFDANGDGIFDPAERAVMRRALTGDLGRLNFFAELSADGERVALGLPDVFDATISDGIVTVVFGFRLDDPVAVAGRKIDFMLRDRDYTAAVAFDGDRPALVRGGEGCTVSREMRPADAYFGGLVVPEAAVLACR
ncbi:DUF1007 family protein [Ciceribacter ferrooxidans]|uniref:DUF1007 family protein n=1 Tax=Ciceribacter ferrooxidans TaxID=2509717 RepID=A0A4Q2T143_9HYPH|nr:DUF1007 family protein [Ciceribacter ferrooxidans]RYC10329.1 DUF1007 family protein [Ciceribacter ferrooxidans]